MYSCRKYLSRSRAIAGFIVLLTALSAHAQVFVETYPPYGTTDMGVRVSGIQNLSDRLSYEKISGSPFWHDEWQLASLYGATEREKWLCRVKLNFATGELYYLDKEEKEWATEDGLVKKIVFHNSNDTSVATAVFVLNPYTVRLNQETRHTYLQVLNDGAYQLLKLNERILGSADSLFGTLKRYFFKDESVYYISHDQTLNTLKKLDRDNLLQFLPGSSAHNDWARQNKINLKKEEDVLRFMNYFNSKK